ncbi:MAG: MauE/DoxX family redox-associated membrane protein [Acidimicrobiales bacterium]
MSTLVAPALVLASLLALAGAQKLLDPTMTVGALRALRVPASPVAVRAGSAVELGLGVGAVVVGGPVLWSLVALSYVAFGVFVIAALRNGTKIGSCGCFGREETPPHWSHVALNAVLAGGSVVVAVRLSGSPLDALADEGAGAALVVALAALALVLLRAAFVELPRTLEVSAIASRARVERASP